MSFDLSVGIRRTRPLVRIHERLGLMFGSGILDIIIALIFVYLLLSLISSAAKEGVESWLKKRAIDLERGIRELLGDPNGAGFAKKLFDHPLICVLYKGWYDPTASAGFKILSGSNLPSYTLAEGEPGCTTSQLGRKGRTEETLK